MAIQVVNDYYTTSDWLAAVTGTTGFAWRDVPVTVNGVSVSTLWAPSYSWALVARDYAQSVSGAGYSWRVAFDAGTADEDPGAGEVRFDHATVESITEAFMNNADAGGSTVSGILALLADPTSVVKGQVSWRNIAVSSEWITADLLGVTAGSGYYKLALGNVEGSAASVPFSASDVLVFGYTRGGDAGDPGTSFQFAFNTATGGGDPGAGGIAFNNADLTAATVAYLDDLDALGIDVSGDVFALGSITSTPKARMVVRSKATPSTVRRYSVTGITDQAGYVQLAITHTSGAGTLATDEAVYVSFVPNGDKGDTGDPIDYGALTAETEVADADQIAFYDADALAVKKITVENLKSSLGAGGLEISAVSTTVNPAVVGTRYVCDTSGGAFTITLPAAPTAGDRIGIADAGAGFAADNLTIARNGNTIGDVAEDLVCDLSTATFELLYVGSTWRII